MFDKQNVYLFIIIFKWKEIKLKLQELQTVNDTQIKSNSTTNSFFFKFYIYENSNNYSNVYAFVPSPRSAQ